MDTIVSVGLDMIKVKNNYITIRDMPDDIKNNFNNQNNMDLTASIIGADDQYIIYINNVDRITAIKSLSHELIHLQQYYSGKLRVIEAGVVMWNGKEINVLDIPYNDRPWEIEAFQGQTDLERKIIETLY
jgi:predicted metallopeptidase